MKRILAILILSAMTVSFVAPFLGDSEDIIKTDVAAQEESTKQTNEKIEEIQEVVKEEKSELEIAKEEYEMKLTSLKQANLSKEDWFKKYKLLIEEYGDILGRPETIYDKYSNEELDLLFKIVQAEIGSEWSFDQKSNVVSVIFNRLDSYGSLTKVLTAKNQFSPYGSGRYLKVIVDEKTILACEYVFMFGDTTNGALFFDSSGKLNYKFLFNDGAHNFYTKRK